LKAIAVNLTDFCGQKFPLLFLRRGGRDYRF